MSPKSRKLLLSSLLSLLLLEAGGAQATATIEGADRNHVQVKISAKEQNLLTMRLHKFIDSRGWLGLQELWDQASAGSGRK